MTFKLKTTFLLLPALGATIFCLYLLLAHVQTPTRGSMDTQPALVLEYALTADSSPAQRALHLELDVVGAESDSGTMRQTGLITTVPIP